MKFENEHEIKFNRWKPGMSGLKLYRFTVDFFGVSVDFDVREWWDSKSLIEDLIVRDFTINSFYLYAKESKIMIIFNKKAS